jgi:hypothetical protein
MSTNMKPETRCNWSPRAKLLASALVVFHLLAVFIAPMWFASGQQSPVIAPLARTYRPYIEAMYLNHGYAFFAPEVGPSHLVEYKLSFAGGRPAETGRFPDKNQQWPRLLYHRHFMLSESLYTYSNLPPLPPAAPQSIKERYAASLQQRDLLKASLANHLRHTRHADGAELHRIEHRLLLVDQFLGGKKLADADTFIDLDAPLPDTTGRELLPGGAP